MCAVQEGIKRAITNIQKTEETLGLEVTAKYKPVVHLTLMAVLILAVAAFITLAVQAFQSTSVSTN
jgi:hypothetical protein